jgi:hypothetical protein
MNAVYGSRSDHEVGNGFLRCAGRGRDATGARRVSTARFSCLVSEFPRPLYRATCQRQAQGQPNRGGPFFVSRNSQAQRNQNA